MLEEQGNQRKPLTEEQIKMIEDAVEQFREISQHMLQAFLYVEEALKIAAQVCVDLANALEGEQIVNTNGESNVKRI